MSSHLNFAIFLALGATAGFAARERGVHPPGYSINVTLPTEAFKNAAGGDKAHVLRATRGPCNCQDGACSCCTGVAMDYIGQKGCVGIEYDPDDFMFAVSMSLNNKTMYKNVMSGKNPRPFCVPVPRLRFLTMCTRLSNVYLTGRNVHACIDMEGRVLDYELFSISFDCVRVGDQGVAVVSPEDGGGLPNVQQPAVDEDYDQLSPQDYDNEHLHEDLYKPTPINLVPTTARPVKATTTAKAKTKKANTATTRKYTATQSTTPISTTTKSSDVEASSQRAAQVAQEDTTKITHRRPRE